MSRLRSLAARTALPLGVVALALTAALSAGSDSVQAGTRNCGSFTPTGTLQITAVTADATFNASATVSVPAASDECAYRVMLTSNDGGVMREDDEEAFSWPKMSTRRGTSTIGWNTLITDEGSESFTLSLVLRRNANNSDVTLATIPVQLPVDGEVEVTIGGEPRYGSTLQVQSTITGYPQPVVTDQYWQRTPPQGESIREPDGVVRHADNDYQYCVEWRQDITEADGVDCSDSIRTPLGPAYDPAGTPQADGQPMVSLEERSMSVAPAWSGEVAEEEIIWMRQLPGQEATDSRQRSRTYVITNIDDGAVIWAQMIARNAMGFPTPTITSKSITLARPSWSAGATLAVTPEYDAAGRLTRIVATPEQATATASPTPATLISWERCLRDETGEVRCGPGEPQAEGTPENAYVPKRSTSADQANEIAPNVVFRAVLRTRNVLGEAVLPSNTVGAIRDSVFEAPAPIAAGPSAPPPEDLTAVPPPQQEAAPVELAPPLTEDPAVIEEAPTTNTAVVRVQGKPVVGAKLVAKWRGLVPAKIQWLRCQAKCRVVRGAVKAHYPLTEQDLGARIRVRIDDGDGVVVTSDPTPRVRAKRVLITPDESGATNTTQPSRDQQRDSTTPKAEPAPGKPERKKTKRSPAKNKPSAVEAAAVNEVTLVTAPQGFAEQQDSIVTELTQTTEIVDLQATVRLLRAPVGRQAGSWRAALCGSPEERGLWKNLLGASAPHACPS